MSEDAHRAALCRVLVEGPVYSFRDWPNPKVPPVAAGVYTVWMGDAFLYAGMSGHGLTAQAIRDQQERGDRRKALYARLNSHASGQRSGDTFCLYICDRYVIPGLTPDEC